jgi:hypothetical protein
MSALRAQVIQWPVRIPVLAVMVLLARAPLSAQGIPTMDSTQLQPLTAAGKFLMHWTVDDGPAGDQTIYVRNISKDRPITVVTWEVYDCVNLSGRACGVHHDGPTIKPGKTERLVTVHRLIQSEGSSYRYRFTARWFEPAPPAPE